MFNVKLPLPPFKIALFELLALGLKLVILHQICYKKVKFVAHNVLKKV